MGTEPALRPLRRSLFFVPGGEQRKLDKARSLHADTLLLDLEDSVALPEKARARELVAEFLAAGDFGGAEPAVRVNPPGTPFFEEDLEAAVRGGARAVMVPKSERSETLREVDALLTSLEKRHQGSGPSPIRILALVETAAGIARADSLGTASPRIEALCFGHADFSRDMELAEADASQGAALHARCHLAIAARAQGLAPIDTVYLDVRNEDGFREDADRGLRLGFEGKLCIHPLQVRIANEVHTPTSEQVAFAQRVLAARDAAEAEGRGVFTVDGKMVDEPLVAAQQRVIERARRAGLIAPSEEKDEH